MPYTLSRSVVERHKRFLDDMKNARRSLAWPAKEPKKLAYKIRNAMNAADAYLEFKEYHGLKYLYRISQRHPDRVEAIWLGDEDGPPIMVKPMTLPDVTDAESVVGACLTKGIEASEIYFPNAIFPDKVLDLLWKWGKQTGWRLISHGPRGTTMTRNPNVDEEILWKPRGGK